MDAALAARVKEIKENPVLKYREVGYLLFADCGEDFNMRESRERVSELGKDADSEVKMIDEIVIEAAIANDYIADSALDDDQTRPLQNWWWHLGKIRHKTYPAELLPNHLQAVYAETESCR